MQQEDCAGINVKLRINVRSVFTLPSEKKVLAYQQFYPRHILMAN
jgi:hypothetical protein